MFETLPIRVVLIQICPEPVNPVALQVVFKVSPVYTTLFALGLVKVIAGAGIGEVGT